MNRLGDLLKTRPALLLLVILLAVSGTYANHFQNGFHFDDFHTIVNNPYIRDLSNLPRFFTDATTFSVLPANRSYRPFVSAALALDYSFGHGYIPFWFHLSTFLVFLAQLALMAWLFIGLLDKTSPEAPLRNRMIALACVAWYGLHPAIAETVNYIIQRGDIFSACGVVAALAIYVQRPQWRRWQIHLLPFAFALLSKPPAFVYPFILFFYLVLFEPSARRVQRALLEVLPSLLLCGALLWLQSAMTPKSFTSSFRSPWGYRFTQPYVWLRYAAELILPIHLNADTDLPTFDALNGRMLLGFAFVIGLFVTARITARQPKLRPVSFGIVWFILTQLPTSLYALAEVENDHRMYLSFVGLSLAVAWPVGLRVTEMIERAAKSGRAPQMRRRVVLGLLVLLCGYAGGTFARNQVWRTEETLWQDDVEKSPNNPRGLMNYGLCLMGRGDYNGSFDLFTRALKLAPTYSAIEINLGIVTDELQRPAESEQHFHQAIALSPGTDEPHYYYARTLFRHQKLAEAKVEAETAISLNPSRLEQQHLLMQIDTALGDDASARAVAMGVLQLSAEDQTAKDLLAHHSNESARYWIELSLRQYQQKQFKESIVSANKAAAIDASSAEAYNNIAAAEAEQQHWDEAIAAAQKAIALRPDFQLAKNNLAWAVDGKKTAKH